MLHADVFTIFCTITMRMGAADGLNSTFRRALARALVGKVPAKLACAMAQRVQVSVRAVTAWRSGVEKAGRDGPALRLACG